MPSKFEDTNGLPSLSMQKKQSFPGVTTLTIYHDFAEFPGWYVNLDAGHSFELTEKISQH
jgi:hypothetical protein